MAEKYVISDTHFYHKRILEFLDNEGKKFRGDLFDTVEEMNECIADNWVDIVKPKDIIYHLGDVHFGNRELTGALLKKLPGRKRLIVGNHDNIKAIAKDNWFQKIYMWRMLPELKAVLTHVPLHPSSLEVKSLVNIIGHIHQNTSPEGPYVNACVEVNNYTPRNIEELLL